MNESFEQYQQRNTPGADKVGMTSGSPMEALAHANWLPWPRKDLAKGGKMPTRGRAHPRMARSGRKKKM